MKALEWFDLDYKQDRLKALALKAQEKVARGRNKRLALGDVIFFRIAEITEGEDVQMYDLEIEDTHNFIANGIVAHNTFAGCLKIIDLATEYPNNLCLVGRLTYPELRDSTREVFLSVLKLLYPAAAYTFNQSENEITFWNKSKVIFRHLDAYENILSMNLGAFYIDQAEEVDEDVFLTLQSRLRRQGIGELKGLITGNPRGYNWVYYRFGMDKAGIGEENYAQTNYRMIVAPTVANAANLPENYIRQLKESYSPEWYARYVLGSWEAFEGQIFDLTKVTGYETLPTIRMVLTACDPAISKETEACNTAFTTLGVGEDGHIYDLETVAGKWSFLETLEEAKKILSRQKSQYLGVESVAYQKALFEACYKYFPDIRVIDLKADKDKFRRAKSVSHIVAKGLFHTNNRELLNEMTAFDPSAKGKERKDRVDALVHCLHMVQQYAPIKFDEIEKDKYKGKSSREQFFLQVEEAEHQKLLGEKKVYNFNPSGNIDPEFY
jgi:predicted phage terminase large subunit-like protein